ncbi:hypothetical protein [Streptomyces sp. NPDC001492]
MTTADDATRAILERGKELLADRMAALEPLAETLAKRKAVEAQLAALNDEYRTRYQTAAKAGWSEEELTAMEAEPPAPAKRGPAKRSSAKRAANRAAPTVADRDKVPGQSAPSGPESPAGDGAATGAGAPAGASASPSV